ncbi:MAG TPA: beta-galactosidase [Candidatus Saccharimonas sp.]|nr:beta-galactosidase [Candidatus Saccharimonas sp.]
MPKNTFSARVFWNDPEWRPFWRRHKWARRISKILLGFIGVVAFVQILNSFVFTEVQHPNYGVSFSIKQARNLGLDWKANFLALVDDLQFKNLRLMSYWDESEPIRGQLNFADLDWQMDQAAKRGVKVSLAVGLRQPRWPECHEPTWTAKLSGNAWKQALYAYIQIVVDRYKNNPALASWQLENEGENNWFGTCDAPDRQRLNEEFNFMKQWDPNHPVEMSLSDEHGLPINPPVPDAYGFSVYRVIWNDKIPPNGYIYYPTPIWYHRLRAAVIQLMQHRPTFIHEMQMEPWGPQDFKNLSIAEQNQSMSVAQIHQNFIFGRKLGMNDIYLWGGEWWYWRKVNGDPSIWNAVKTELAK